MTTVTIKGYVYQDLDALKYEEKPRYVFFAFRNAGGGYAEIGEHTISYQIPGDWNPVAAAISAIEAQKKAALDAYNETVGRLNEKLSKLTAISCEVA